MQNVLARSQPALRPWGVVAGGYHPAVKELPDDIPLLVRHFVQQFTRRLRKTIDTIVSDTMQGLMRYVWQGNPLPRRPPLWAVIGCTGDRWPHTDSCGRGRAPYSLKIRYSLNRPTRA